MIKYIVGVLAFILSVSCKEKQQITSINWADQESHFSWNHEKERAHNENRNDTSTYSQANWEADQAMLKRRSNLFMKYGVFPVPKYDLIDTSFNGLGYSGDWQGYKLGDKTLIYHSLYVNSNNLNKEYIGQKDNEVFFTIVVSTDYVNTQKFDHTNVSISSRNYPHYVGQGFVKTRDSKVDFLAFLTADRNEYAVVNMRLFDLRIGRIVLIAPQDDGTFRSLQLDAPIMASDEMDNYLINLFQGESKVQDFFSAEGGI